MVSQEEVFNFFQKMSISLERDGYKILDNLNQEFPNIKYEEEILKDQLNEKHLDELEDQEPNDQAFE